MIVKEGFEQTCWECCSANFESKKLFLENVHIDVCAYRCACVCGCVGARVLAGVGAYVRACMRACMYT